MRICAAPAQFVPNRIKRIVTRLALVATLSASLVVGSAPPADALSLFDQEVLTLINDHRQSLGLNDLTRVVAMSDAAQEWSFDVYDLGVERPRCDPLGEVNTGPDRRLQGAPAGVSSLIEGVVVTCGFTGLAGGFSGSTPDVFPECRQLRDLTKAIDQFCRLVQTTNIRAAIFRPDIEFAGIGTRRVVESTSVFGDNVRMVTTVRMGSSHPCLGLDITIDMNTNGGDGTGTTGDDVILGTSGPDRIEAGDGDDVICGGDGDDIIEAGPGDDRVIAGAGEDQVFGRRGDDIIEGGFGTDTIHGNKGRDVLRGGFDDDKIFGYADADRIEGGPGNDRLHGNFGDDVIYGGSGNDRIFGYGDNDSLIGEEGDDLITGNFGDDFIRGDQGNDIMFGSDGEDELDGGPGSDRIEGNSLNDTIDGGSGDDTIDGGIGFDVCDGGDDSDIATRCEEITAVP